MAFFSNLGKVYVIRALDVPATTGFGEPIGSLLSLADGEFMVGLIAPEPARGTEPKAEIEDLPDRAESVGIALDPQYSMFEEAPATSPDQEKPALQIVSRGVLVTRGGQGFRFDYEILRETTKRIGRKLVNLRGDDQMLVVIPEEAEFIAVASSSGKLLVFPVDRVPVLTGPGQGVRLIKLTSGSEVVALHVVAGEDKLLIQPKEGKEETLAVRDIPIGNRATQGKTHCKGILAMERVIAEEGRIR